MGDVLISASELLSKNPSSIPPLARDFSNSSFWYYTTLVTADKIMSGCSFWVSNLCDMNDIDELKLHEQMKKKIFALCFCNSNTEKIPMWYLYSGIAGKGLSIGLTPGCMLDFLRSLISVKGIQEDDKQIDLSIGSDIELKFGWVYYRKKREPNQVFYKNKWYTLKDPYYFEAENYFLKAYPWEYEKEFRIVFVNKTKIEFKRLIVFIPNSIRQSMKLRLAPEITLNELQKNKELHYVGKEPLQNLMHSELNINMNLLKRNRKSLSEYLPEYLREELTNNEPDVHSEELCEIIQGASRCIKSKSIDC